MNKEEMINVYGGAAVKTSLMLLIGGAIGFLVGVFSGFYNTKSCRL